MRERVATVERQCQDCEQPLVAWHQGKRCQTCEENWTWRDLADLYRYLTQHLGQPRRWQTPEYDSWDISGYARFVSWYRQWAEWTLSEGVVVLMKAGGGETSVWAEVRGKDMVAGLVADHLARRQRRRQRREQRGEKGGGGA